MSGIHHASLLPLLACPIDGQDLHSKAAFLVCPQGHRFPIVDGVPVLLRADVPQTIGIAEASLTFAALAAEGRNNDPEFIGTLGISETAKSQLQAEIACGGQSADPVISYLVGATNGILYKHLIGSLDTYPIPELPLPPGNGQRLLDVGCNWGRWSVSAARKGYLPVGIDPSLGAVLAAQRLAASLGLPFMGVVGDARFLPFKLGAFDAAFSYSVLQHFSKSDARKALQEIDRVLRKGGRFQIQMASAWGIRSFQHQLRRGFRPPRDFEVRYWSPFELRRAFTAIFGNARMTVDCYFGLGLQASDIALMPASKKAVIQLSEFLKRLSRPLLPLRYAADSLWFGSR